MSVRLLASLCLILLPSWLFAQGFAGLGSEADGFSVPQRGTQLSFPQDHGPHPDYRIEWWYLTATLTGDDGQDYGIQWTLFRSALAPFAGEGLSSPQVWLGHAAVTTQHEHLYAERLSRGGISVAGVSADPFVAEIDDWYMRSTETSGDPLDRLALAASGPAFRYKLDLAADGPLVFHGDNGFSVKSQDGQASYYYAQPHYTVSGVLSLPTGDVAVTGAGWLDREWSSQPLSDNQTGWDWFSLAFDNGEKVMAFRLRDDQTGFRSGTWIAADGSTSTLRDGDITLTPTVTTQTSGARVPTEWRVDIPSSDTRVTITALNPNSWMGTTVPYWEGPVYVSGSHSGRGYLEMTGYE